MKYSALLTLCALPLLTLAACSGGGGPASTALSTNANLADLSISAGTLDPPFSSDTLAYQVGPQEMLVHGSVTLTPLAAHGGATITVDGLVVASGSPSSVIDVSVTVTPVLVRVTAEDGETVREYNVIITRQGISLQTDYVKASNTGEDDQFGWSVALDGDTLVVGAHYEDSDATGVDGDQDDDPDLNNNSGAVYVFVRSDGTWTQQAYLKAHNTGASDYFGYSVALDGDTVVVGAWGEDSNATGVNDSHDDTQLDLYASGAAYVFVRSDGTWSQQAYLKAHNTGDGDYFGQSVALHGDTVVVGAHRESSDEMGVTGVGGNDLASQSGAAYVFVRSGVTWSQQAYLKAHNTEVGGWFGFSVALDGDTLGVGAVGENSNATGVDQAHDDNLPIVEYSGAAYVFFRDGVTWSQEVYLKAHVTDYRDNFGTSLALDGDTLVVGADGEDSNATGVDGDDNDLAPFSGAAYVFVRSDGTWTQQAYLKAHNTGEDDQFGESVALDGDTLVVGAIGEESNATGVDQAHDGNLPTENFSGAAYVFVRSGGIWSQENYLKASNTDQSDQFARRVALYGDTVVVGAPREDSDATGVNGEQDHIPGLVASGAIYIFK